MAVAVAKVKCRWRFGVSVYLVLAFWLSGVWTADTAIGYILLFLTDMPVCIFLICGIHEMAHFFLFLAAGTKVVSLRIGMVSVCRNRRFIRVKIVESNPLTGNCIVMKEQFKTKCHMIVALMGGGVAGFLTAFLIVSYSILGQSGMSPFCLALAFSGLTNGICTLVNPDSADRRLIRLYR